MFGRKKNDDVQDAELREPVDGLRTDDAATLVAHEERLVADAQKQVSGHVRISKRTITEERTVTVQLTREQLVVEHLDADGKVVRVDRDDEAGVPEPRRLLRRGTNPLHELTLYGEDVDIVKRRRPIERVKVYVDSETEEQRFSEEVRKEVIEVEHDDRRDDTDLSDIRVERDGDVRR